MKVQKFTVPGMTLGRNELEALARAHWSKAAKAKRDETKLVCACIRKAGIKPMETPCEVTVVFAEQVTFYKNGRRRKLHDVDNRMAGVKPVLDALVKCGIIPDDGPEHVRRVIPIVKYTCGKPYIRVALMPYEPHRRVTFAPVEIPEELT